MKQKRSNNNVDKKLEAVSSSMMADKDPLHNIELELAGTLKQMFEEAKQEGFKGDFNSYLDSLSLEELKSVGAANGGMIKKLYEV
tara:strand:+ start:360 stop:614 length:255 start_codon:yes stop_codon:yes gene_type:complete